MTKKFDSKGFIKEISEDIVSNFDRAAKATTPGLKGAAREHEIRRKLESLLPSGVGVGSGCIIDHEGNASKQQDVVLFEKNLCPVFSINETPESTYYPCEGVIAVGEIKSSIGKSEVEDSFSKIESVKKLKRLPIVSKSVLTDESIVSFRKYLSMQSYDCTQDEQFDQDKNPNDQIFGFILCGDFAVKIDTLCAHVSNQTKAIDVNLLPNIIASLHNGVFSPYHQENNSLCHAVTQGTGYVYGMSESGSFEYLLAKLHQAIRSGRTVEVSAFERYIIKEPNKMQLTVNNVISR